MCSMFFTLNHWDFVFVFFNIFFIITALGQDLIKKSVTLNSPTYFGLFLKSLKLFYILSFHENSRFN